MEERDITMKEAKTGQQGGQSSNIAQDIANGSDHDTTTVTTDSPTPSTSAFEPYQQQLQEAMLAAVNSQGLGSLSHNNLIAAVAAAAAAASAQQHQQQQQQQQHLQQSQHQAAKRPQQNIDRAKLDSIRASNRERKKRWRLLNEERSKYIRLCFWYSKLQLTSFGLRFVSQTRIMICDAVSINVQRSSLDLRIQQKSESGLK